MKISINTIRQISRDFGSASEPAPEGVDKLVERIGAQLGGVEETIDIGSKYDGVVIVRVVSCVDHPNADRLHVCMVDDGGVTPDVPRDENGLVQVVCGAPNVRDGVTVAWLPPGTTVPSTYDSDPFVLEARELRGVVSNGMLASPKELAIGDSHEGLLLIDGDVVPGTMLADQYELRGDVLIDIENKMFTHRPDCFGWLGVAREIAGIQHQPFKSPDWYSTDVRIAAPDQDSLSLEVRNEIPELVPRFTAVALADINLGPSPVWLQVVLAKHGLRPINNIVDLTNYYMLLTGQPLHAYDYDKVRALDGGDKATLVVRKPYTEEKLMLLNGKEVAPRAEAIMIATDSQAIGLGGVMGGGNTEVNEHTRNVILECATFDMYSIRRTSMSSGIFTDAVTRFNKGQSPLQNMAVLARIVEDVQRLAGGYVASQPIDINHTDIDSIKVLHEPITVPVKFINDRLGLELTDQDIIRLLENVEFHVHDMGHMEEVCVSAPFWRTDIEIPEDIVEEVGRLYGFDHLPLVLPRRTIQPARRNGLLDLKDQVREILSAAGANEILAYSFVHGNLLETVGQDKAQAYKLGNALSPDLQYYRLALTPSLLEKVQPNVRAGHDEFALFEMGKVHNKTLEENGLPVELDRLAFVYAYSRKDAQGAAYYHARVYLDTVLRQVGLTGQVTFVPLNPEAYEGSTKQKISMYEPKRAATVLLGDTVLGEIGEYKSTVRAALKLPDQVAGFELDLSLLPHDAQSQYESLSRYPSVWQDISLKVPADRSYADVYAAVADPLQSQQAEGLRVAVDPLDIYRREDDAEHKQITLRVTVTSYERTLTDTEVSTMLDTAAANAAELLGAVRL